MRQTSFRCSQRTYVLLLCQMARFVLCEERLTMGRLSVELSLPNSNTHL